MTTISYKVAIIGAGLIGKKRAAALAQIGSCELASCADINLEAAKELTGQFGGKATSNWQQAASDKDVSLVIVATYNKSLAPICIEALQNGKHVLCEKPLGRNCKEAAAILNAAKGSGVVLKTGFNHRHHPAIVKARQVFGQGEIGKLSYIRCRYGHGGRPGYENEWRGNKDICGGGEMLDQGVHVVDLFRYFAGEFNYAFGYTPTYFWDMAVEDNAFALFRRDDGVIAAMHTSWTQWKNLFSFEIFGSDGYLLIDGLGGSYGTETLHIGTRRPEGGRPDEKVMKFEGPDNSWQDELTEFISAIEADREPIGSGWDGFQAHKMIEAVYESANTAQMVEL